jgi:hypothetical protein
MRCRAHSVPAGAVVLVLAMLVACSSYRAKVEPVADEILVKLVTDRSTTYDHPVRLTAHDLAAILDNVRVEYKANWLQRLVTGPFQPLRLLETRVLPRVVSPLVRAFQEAGPHDRIVFYVAERRSDVRREVTTGSLFVTGRLLHIVLTNYRNGVDVITGVETYDRRNPEIAVAPQRFVLVFNRPEFLVEPELTLVQRVLEGTPPSLVVDYQLFLNLLHRQSAQSAFLSLR